MVEARPCNDENSSYIVAQWENITIKQNLAEWLTMEVFSVIRDAELLVKGSSRI